MKIAYRNDDGDRYQDEFPLDVDLLRKRTYVESSTTPEGQAKENIKLLRDIRRSLDSLAETGQLLTREEWKRQFEELTAFEDALPGDEGQPAP